MFGEEQTRTLLGPADPVRHRSVAPPQLSAHDLIVRAEADAGPVANRRPARPTRRRVLMAGAMAVAVGTVAITQTFGPSGPEIVRPPESDPGVVLVPVAYGSGTRDAASPLRALASRIVDAEHDNRTGRYMYHHTKTWGDPVMTSPDGRHHVAFATETKVWQAADGTGRQVHSQLDPQYPDQESRAYWQRNLTTGPAVATPDSIPLPPMDLAPLPADRAQLNDLLKTGLGGGVVGKEVSTVYGRYVVPRRTRAEVLRVLADVPGFRWRGQVTDRAGREGVAITFDDREHNQQTLLIFDPNTGELLAHELLTLSPVRMSAYQVILDTSWTDRLG